MRVASTKRKVKLAPRVKKAGYKLTRGKPNPRVVVEPKSVFRRKQWKKSSRWRAAMKAAKRKKCGRHYNRLTRLANGANPFRPTTLDLMNEVLLEETQRYWETTGCWLYEELTRPGGTFPENMGECVSRLVGWRSFPETRWQKIKRAFRGWVASTDYWPGCP